jgi:hypothetical protein
MTRAAFGRIDMLPPRQRLDRGQAVPNLGFIAH